MTKRRVRNHVKKKRKPRKRNKNAVPLTNVEQAARHESLGTEKHTPLATQCRLHIHSKRRRLVDSDGISTKAAIDSLVHAGLLEDDGPTFVDTSISFSQEKVSKDEIEETIIYVYQQGEEDE